MKGGVIGYWVLGIWMPSDPPNTQYPITRYPMKYICLVYQDDENLIHVTDPEFDAVLHDCGEWVDDLEKSGKHVFSAGLLSRQSATTLRTINGKVAVTDGPYAETKEYLGGFTVFEARDLNDAIQMISHMPALRMLTLEIRPVMDMENPDLSDPIAQKVAESVRRSSKQTAPA